MAGAAMIGGDFQLGESILLQNGMVYFAIENNILMHNWKRALELAMKHKTHVDTVLYKRIKYLEKLGKKEPNKAFLSAQSGVSNNLNIILNTILNYIMKETIQN